jgi:hypothetical protein
LEQCTGEPDFGQAGLSASIPCFGEMFPNSHLRCLGTDDSDHFPLLLHTNLGSMSKSRFHFEVFWPKFVDYE